LLLGSVNQLPDFKTRLLTLQQSKGHEIPGFAKAVKPPENSEISKLQELKLAQIKKDK